MCLPLKPFRVEREWKHAGLWCAVVQAREASHRCGYVRVPPSHPYFGKGYDDIGEVDAHGGFTFADIEPCTEHEDGQGWWFGFDFAHLDDAMLDPNPDLLALSPEARDMWDTMNRIHTEVHMEMYGKVLPSTDHFWTQAEVERECEMVAEQLAAITGEPGVYVKPEKTRLELAREALRELGEHLAEEAPRTATGASLFLTKTPISKN